MRLSKSKDYSEIEYSANLKLMEFRPHYHLKMESLSMVYLERW